MDSSDGEDIVIVGGGICGLATAIALQRKGVSSAVLERSDTLQTTGAAIGIHTNGWRALDQLGVGDKLRQKAIHVPLSRDVNLDTGTQRETPYGAGEEVRCLKRSDLMEVLLDALPPKSIRFGCQIINVGQDPLSSFPVVRLRDGSIINTKVLIGCDGANSIVAQSLGLSAPRLSSICSTRGFTNYPNGHDFPNEFIKLRRSGLLVGRIPVDDKLMYWFIGRRRLPKEFELRRDLDLLKEVTIKLLEGFPQEIIDMVKCSNRDSIILSSIRYRAPWDLLMKRHTSGTITVAGDAMHVMGPFLGQGGAAALEDAVVLARCISRAMAITTVGSVCQERVVGALQSYVKERMVRLLRLSTQAYLTGLLLESSFVGVKIVVLLILVLLFGGNSVGHIKYDCGEL